MFNPSVSIYMLSIPSLYTVSMSSLTFPPLYRLYTIYDTYGTIVYRTIPCLYYIIRYRHIFIVPQHDAYDTCLTSLTISMSSIPSLHRTVPIPYDMVPYRTVLYTISIVYIIRYHHIFIVAAAVTA